MKFLPVQKILNENTRLQSVILHIGNNGIYDLHYGKDDQTFYVTEHGKPKHIVLIATKEIWNLIFESK